MDALPDVAYVYMVRCTGGQLYTGWTNHPAARLKAHQSGKGARYTRAHGAVGFAYLERCADKRAALRREAALKKLPKPEKEALAAQWTAENTITLRDAAPEDAAAVAELYNWYVTHSTATFQYDLCTEEFQRENIAYVQQRAPFLVAVNAAGKLCGFACAHPWHSRTAYAWDVELTVYCAHDCVGQGVGGRLYKALLDGVRQRGYCNAVALVTGQNKESCAFHKALGFKKIGVEPRTGYKFGQWLDLAYWWMDLRPGQEPPEPVRLGQ